MNRRDGCANAHERMALRAAVKHMLNVLLLEVR